MIKAETKQHTLSDGRTLAYCQQGTPVFFAHGGPGSRLEGELFRESAFKRYFMADQKEAFAQGSRGVTVNGLLPNGRYLP